MVPPLASQLTLGLSVPVTVAVNCTVAPAATLDITGDTVTTTPGGLSPPPVPHDPMMTANSSGSPAAASARRGGLMSATRDSIVRIARSPGLSLRPLHVKCQIADHDGDESPMEPEFPVVDERIPRVEGIDVR